MMGPGGGKGEAGGQSPERRTEMVKPEPGEDGLHDLEHTDVQRWIIERWAAMQDPPLTRNDAARKWIEEGMAARYRAYIQHMTDKRISLQHESEIQELLRRIADTDAPDV